MSATIAATLITGATEGIGRALAHEFARMGNNLFLISRDKKALTQLCGELTHTHDVTVEHLDADLSTTEDRKKISPALDEADMYVDKLVNNAAIGLCEAFVDHEKRDLTGLVELNVSALTELCREFLPAMVDRRRGGIMNIASLGGMTPGPYQAAYYASKAYVISLTEALAQEVAGTSVRISVVIPGPVDTLFHQKMGAENALYLKFFPPMNADRAARAAGRGYNWRRTKIAPGIFNSLASLVLPLIPHWITSPIMAWLLKPRRD